MKVALIHDHLNQIGGAEKVLKAFTEIFPDAPIYTLIHDQSKTKTIFPNQKIHESFLAGWPLARKYFRLYLPLMAAATEAYDLSDYDVVLSDSSGFAKGVITKPETLHVCYCHTPTRYLWSDYNLEIDPLEKNRSVKRISQFLKSRLRLWDRLAADRVDEFIANSKFIAGRIKKYYRRDSHVIYPPVDARNFYIANKTENYFLIIGRLRPYKRIDIAVEAFNRLNIPLKIIGGGEELSRLKKLARPHIEFLGNVTDKEKAKYLAHCRAFIHPQEEDFGITAIEAMASGRPVIAYGKGGALETVIPGKTGVLFEEQEWESLADAVIRLKDGKFNPSEIREYALRFDTKRFKKEIKEFIEENFKKYQEQQAL